jgi:hypothetical protein
VLPARTSAPGFVPPINTQVERFFHFALAGLVGTACCALASSGYLDRPALLVIFLGLLLRVANIAGILRFRVSSRLVSIVVTGCIALIPLDFYFMSGVFLTSIVHGVCFLTVVKVLTAQSDRDYLYTGAISLLALIAAALLSAQPAFFGWLLLYVIFAIGAFTSAEIRSELGRHSPPPGVPNARIVWRLAGLACGATAGILLTTALIFLLIPRTARAAARLLPNTPRLTGFSNHIDLGGLGKISRDTRAVMHISSQSGPLPPDLKWRGAALSLFDGRSWSEPVRRMRPVEAAPGPAVLAGRLQLSRRDGRRLLYHVDVRNADTGTLFVAGVPEFINIDTPVLYVNRELAIHVPPQFRETLRYDVSAHFGPPLPQPLTSAERIRYLQFPPLDPRIVTLARAWSGTGSPADRAQKIERHLQREFKYKLDGPPYPVADPLADFLFVRKEGYCEYFASAMAVMLRSIGIPSRVATGFQSGYFNDVSGLNVVRASDAHAWVEAWIESPSLAAAGATERENGAWMTFDPTPPASAVPAVLSHLDMVFDAVDNTWRDWVVSYDLSHQVLMAARFEDAIRRFRRTPNFGIALLYWLASIAGLAALAFFAPRIWRGIKPLGRFRKSRRAEPSASEATALYQQMMRRLARQGIHKHASVTPNEFAAGLPDVAAFTALYNSVRFGGNSAEAPRLALLLKSLKAVRP